MEKLMEDDSSGSLRSTLVLLGSLYLVSNNKRSSFAEEAGRIAFRNNLFFGIAQIASLEQILSRVVDHGNLGIGDDAFNERQSSTEVFWRDNWGFLSSRGSTANVWRGLLEPLRQGDHVASVVVGYWVGGLDL